MIMKKLRFAAALAMMTMLACACDPEHFEDDIDEPLASISYWGEDVYSFTYNDSGRIATITDNLNDIRISVRYNPLRLTIGGEEIKNIKCNDKGYIESFWGDSPDGATAYCEYDADGHLLQFRMGDFYKVDLKWEKDCLVQVKDYDEGDLMNTVNYEYKNDDNRNGLWIPLWQGPMEIPHLMTTGLFGKIPSKLVSRISSQYPGGYNAFSYKLNKQGLILSMHVDFGDGGSYDDWVFNYDD